MKYQLISIRNSLTTPILLYFIFALGIPLVAHAHAGPHGGVDTSPEPNGVSPFTVVASGLSNPRGILIEDGNEDDDSEPAIYVTEAGHGGEGPCLHSPNGDYFDCYGPTGAITRIKNGIAERIVTGLPSFAGPNGGYAVGPSRIISNGQSLFVSFANYGDPEERAVATGADIRFGKLLRLRIEDGVKSKVLADISAFEDLYNPDGDVEVESNPLGLAFGRGKGFYVTDAAANDLLIVRPSDLVSLRYVFPERNFPAPDFLGLPPGTLLPVQAVPTAVVKGPDGAHYVAEFTGFPYPQGQARVFRVGKQGDPTVYADGFSNIIDLAFGPDGSLYVLEMAKYGLVSQNVTGAVTRISPDGVRTLIADTGLAYPTAIAVDRLGKIYVANYGTSGSNGQLVILN